MFQYRIPDGDPKTDDEPNEIKPHNFKMSLTGDYSTHTFVWKKDYLHFESYHGHYENLPSEDYLISNKTWEDSRIPPDSNETVHLNLWLVNGSPPSDGQSAEMVVKEFKFIPLEEPNITIESWSYDDYLPTVLDKILGILGRDVNVQGRFEAALDSIDNVKQAEVEFKLGYIPVKDIGSTYNPLDTENPDIVWETKTFEMKRVDESFIAESEVTTWWPANLLVNFNTLLTGKGLVEYMGQSIFLPEIKTYITGDEPIYIYAEITKIKCIDTKDNYLEFSINKEIPTLYQKVHNAWLEQQLQLQEYQIVSVMCPVNVTITDQYGRTISDNGINGILAANMTLTKEIKIFYLPADLTYSTEVAAYDTGMFNFTKVLPIGTDISITKFENISITASTKAFVEIEPNVINYTMSIDYDGDGEADEVVYPDVNETIEVEQLPTITSVSPTNAATNVPLATTINATFIL